MGKTILIVDDSVTLRASVQFFLSNAGFNVVEAVDGKDGLKKLEEASGKSEQVAMIISDIHMPNMDGITFIKEVKKTAHKFVPILIMTTESQEQKKQEGKSAGAAGWLVKPFQPDQLLSVIKKFVPA